MVRFLKSPVATARPKKSDVSAGSRIPELSWLQNWLPAPVSPLAPSVDDVHGPGVDDRPNVLVGTFNSEIRLPSPLGS